MNSVDNKTEIVYNKAMQTVSSTDENGETTKYTYDSRYRVKTETASDKSVEYEYDSNGNVVKQTTTDLSEDGGDSSAVEEFEPKGLMIYTINALIQNKLFAIISFCGEKICGVIDSLHGNMISVIEYNEYGFCDGTSTLNLDNITCIEFDSRETKRVQALADMRAAGRE
mgnify:FL=1